MPGRERPHAQQRRRSESDGGENRVLLVPMQLAYLSPVLVPTLVAGVRRVWREPGLRWARAAVLVYPVVAVAHRGRARAPARRRLPHLS